MNAALEPVLIAVALISTLSFAAVISRDHAPARPDEPTIAAEDHAAILELVARDSFTWDAADGPGFSALFTDDAEAY